MADDAQLKWHIKQLLESWQFEVDPLDEDGASLTPDFALRAGEEQYLLEVKHKEDDAALRDDEVRRLADGETVWRAEPWGRRNRIAGVIRHGVEQLSAATAPPDVYRLLWLHAGGEDPALYWEQFHGTLYGTTNVFQLRGQGSWTCYYFYDSAFYRWRRMLVGAVIADNESAQLCVNSYAANAAGLRASRLARRFGTGICDPVDLEEQGAALIADCDVDRADSSRVMQYLQGKYEHGLLTNLDLGKLTAAIAVDAQPSDATDDAAAADQLQPDDPGETLDR